MNPILERFLRELADAPGAAVTRIGRNRGVVTADVSGGGVAASLVCNESSPPSGRDNRGRKFYGAYVIADEGYGDWVKGDNAEECVAYVTSWLPGRAIRRSLAVGPTRIDLMNETATVLSEPDLARIERELSERSSLRLAGRDYLLSLDGVLSVRLEVGEGVIAGVMAGERVQLSAETEGILAAAILGFLDGISEGSDD